MSTIFDLHAAVLADYRDFVRFVLTVADERALAGGPPYRTRIDPPPADSQAAQPV